MKPSGNPYVRTDSPEFSAILRTMRKVAPKPAPKSAPPPPPSPPSPINMPAAAAASVAPPADPPVSWQYETKNQGWQPFDAQAVTPIEAEYQKFLADPHNYDVREVRSGRFRYFINFAAMRQTNIDHDDHRERAVRRVTQS